jgi:hypothetical protein
MLGKGEPPEDRDVKGAGERSDILSCDFPATPCQLSSGISARQEIFFNKDRNHNQEEILTVGS